MSDPRYLTRMTKDANQKSLDVVLNECPANYMLHSVVPVHATQYGVTFFYVIFAECDFGNQG
jgi:hypothetical protein